MSERITKIISLLHVTIKNKEEYLRNLVETPETPFSINYVLVELLKINITELKLIAKDLEAVVKETTKIEQAMKELG